MSEIVTKAKAKLDLETKQFKGGAKEKAVYKYVSKTLKQFCQNDQFAQAVADNTGTLSDCCKEIMKNVGESIPDIEVYRKATEFYFPHAVVDFTMNITIGVDTLAVGEPVVDGATDYIEATETPAKKKSTRPPKPKADKASESGFVQISLF